MVSTTSTPSSPICTAALTDPPTSIQTLPWTRIDCTAGAWPLAIVIAVTTSPAIQAMNLRATLLGPAGDLPRELGQRRLGASPRGLHRDVVLLGVVVQKRV